MPSFLMPNLSSALLRTMPIDESPCSLHFSSVSLVMTTPSKQAALKGFFGGSDGKESAYNVGHLGSIPGLGRSPGGGYGNPLQYSCLENPHGQRSLTGYSPWGHNESDVTERLSTHTHTHTHTQRFTCTFLLI